MNYQTKKEVSHHYWYIILHNVLLLHKQIIFEQGYLCVN